MIFVIGSLAFVLIIISLIHGLLSIANEPEEMQVIEGGKYDALARLDKLIDYCWGMNSGSHESNVCFLVKTNITGEITENDIKSFVRRVNPSLIHSVTINQSTSKIVIKYQNGQIFIEER